MNGILIPLSPTEKGENLYARGSTDMKGQIIATFSAIKAIRRDRGFAD